jgi:hypothetical protein
MRFISQAQKMVTAAFNIFSNTGVLKLRCIPVCTDVCNPTIIQCFQNSVRMKQYLIKLGVFIGLLMLMISSISQLSLCSYLFTVLLLVLSLALCHRFYSSFSYLVFFLLLPSGGDHFSICLSHPLFAIFQKCPRHTVTLFLCHQKSSFVTFY